MNEFNRVYYRFHMMTLNEEMRKEAEVRLGEACSLIIRAQLYGAFKNDNKNYKKLEKIRKEIRAIQHQLTLPQPITENNT